jgi:hypothetical protein
LDGTKTQGRLLALRCLIWLTMMYLRPISRVVARPQRRTFIDWMTNYPDRVSPVVWTGDRGFRLVGLLLLALGICRNLTLLVLSIYLFLLFSYFFVFFKYISNDLCFVMLSPDFGVEEASSSGRTVRLYLAETTQRQVDGRPSWNYLYGGNDSTGHWPLSIGDWKRQDGVKYRKCSNGTKQKTYYND